MQVAPSCGAGTDARAPPSDPIGVLARLQLARALVLSGDKPAARAAYRHFLTLWKDADPDIPILQQARIECAALL